MTAPKGFDFNGSWITDPFVDETGRLYVDPIAHYGQAYLDWRAAGGKLDHETT